MSRPRTTEIVHATRVHEPHGVRDAVRTGNLFTQLEYCNKTRHQKWHTAFAVVGQIPLLASVPATTDIDLVFISTEHI